ncbi:MAG: LapA family protein [Firmicutes bacterium]|nr:LapA family protein [Bacillota bacterium]
MGEVVARVFLIVGFAFALIVALFAVQNSMVVSVRFFTWGFETSLVLVVIASAALGAMSAGVLGLPGSIRLRLKVRELDGKIRRLESELKAAREAAAPATQPALDRQSSQGEEGAGDGSRA